MKLTDLLVEAPIADLKVADGFSGKGYASSDSKRIPSSEHQEKYREFFKKVPVDVNFYFWDPDSRKADGSKPSKGTIMYYGIESAPVQVGSKPVSWIKEHLGKNAAEWASKTSNSSNISVIITNNLSDEKLVSLTPWMLAHRFAHALTGGPKSHSPLTGFITRLEKSLLEIIKTGYDVEEADPGHPSHLNNYHVWEDAMNALIKHLAHHLGTMRSARKKNLVTYFEFIYELFAQYILKGQIELNPLPEKFHDDHPRTRDERKWKKALQLWARLPRIAEEEVKNAFHLAKGKIYVM